MKGGAREIAGEKNKSTREVKKGKVQKLTAST